MTDLVHFTGKGDVSSARNEAHPAIHWMPSRLVAAQPSRIVAGEGRSKLSWRDFGLPLEDGAEGHAAAA